MTYPQEPQTQPFPQPSTPNPVDPPALQPTRKRRSIVLVAAGVVCGVAIGAGAVFGYQAYADQSTKKSDTITMMGQITLTKYSGWDATNDGCSGKGGYSDIGRGTGVTIKAGSGEVVGVGRLARGVVITGGCQFTWIVADIPGDEQFYTVEISHRGAMTYSRAGVEGVLKTSLGD